MLLFNLYAIMVMLININEGATTGKLGLNLLATTNKPLVWFLLSIKIRK